MSEVNQGMDDDELMDTIGGDEEIGAEELSRMKKDEAKYDKQLEAMDKKIEKLKGKEDKIEASLDPQQEFVGILRSMGLKKGVQVMADVFYAGDVNSPEHLDNTLVLGGLSMPQRRLIITRYYGQSPDQLGIALVSKGGGSGSGGSGSDSGEGDVRQTATQMMKERLHAAQTRAMIKEFEKMDNPEKEEKPKPKKVIERPMISREGEIIMKDGVPVVERIIVEGSEYQGSNEGSLSNMLMLMKLMEKKDASPPHNPNEKPAWAIELENTIKVNKAEEERKRLEDELKREKEKREEREAELKKEIEREKESNRKEIERQKADHVREMDRQKSEIDYRLTSLKDSFDNEIKHRDTIDSIKDAYGERFDEMKKEIDLTKKDIKSAVASEMTKTGSKVIDRMTQTADGVIQPMAEVMKDMYSTQIDMMRKQQGLPGKGIPDSSEDELKRLV